MFRIKTVSLIFHRLKIFVRKLRRRFPKKLKKFIGPFLGGLAGLIGGILGVIIGIILGYFLGELFSQFGRDSKVIDFFKNPGSRKFPESEPGLAAWCALAVLILSKESPDLPAENSADHEAAPEKVSSPDVKKISRSSSEMILRQVSLCASYIFIGRHIDISQVEYFSRLALSQLANLNSDLLAESLSAGRLPQGDAPKLGRCLYILADGAEAKTLAREIRLILDPSWNEERENDSPLRPEQKDPWKILGLPPGTPQSELKNHYRRLAKQFHPDEFHALDEHHRETAAEAFMAIKEAYKEVSEASKQKL